jgi:AAA domain
MPYRCSHAVLVCTVCQNHDEVVGSRLKRVILIGDHNQLPPVVKNVAFQNYGNLDQSLFTRFVRLGIPTVELNKQGRSRPSIAGLYSWRYSGLGNMPVVESAAGYLRANAGFTHEFQLIDVPDLNGQGESQPQPHFYQNVAEAEYVVATFQYMRLLGYPAHSISILTTYNGQKLLIDDIIAAVRVLRPMWLTIARWSMMFGTVPLWCPSGVRPSLCLGVRKPCPRWTSTKANRTITCCCHWFAAVMWDICVMFDVSWSR